MNGEINCIDPAGYGAVTITKSITIDCRQTLGSILYSGTNAVNIPYDSFVTPGEVRKTVRLRGLSLNGVTTGIAGVRITGGASSAGSAVYIEDCVIDGNFAGIARGISDERAGGGELYVTGTTVRNNGGTGIVVSPLSGGSGARIDVIIDSSRVENSGLGVAAGNAVRMMINNSVFTGNSGAGLDAEGPVNAMEMTVDRSVISSNGTGILVVGSATVRIGNNDIAFNATAISGPTQSFGNNRIAGNTAAGTAPTPIGADAAAKGQQ